MTAPTWTDEQARERFYREVVWGRHPNDEDFNAVGRALLSLEAEVARLTQERNEARALAQREGLSGDAIMEARAYLNEHLEPLGAKVNCAFFDDCIHNAVAFALIHKERAEKAEAERDALRVSLEILIQRHPAATAIEQGNDADIWGLNRARAELRRVSPQQEKPTT